MTPRMRRWIAFVVLAVLSLYGFYVKIGSSWTSNWRAAQPFSPSKPPLLKPGQPNIPFEWRNVRVRYPVKSMQPLPTGSPAEIPRIQYDFAEQEPADAKKQRLERRAAVKEAFVHAWEGYRKQAWLHDEVRPLSGRTHDPFGGWGATLVDTLDTLWIMDMHKDFAVAVAALDQIDFSKCAIDTLNIFETTIRYLGGFLGAYDISQGKYPKLLEKAVEVGEMLYVAFDTPNHMPITRWKWRDGAAGTTTGAPESALIAELGSLTLEFTRLSQLTGDPKFYDAVQRISDLLASSQNNTKLPGLWPVGVNLRTRDLVSGSTFTIGGMADSVFEYLPKTYLLHRGRLPQPREMYLTAAEAITTYLAFEPLIPPSTNPLPPLMLGTMSVSTSGTDTTKTLDPQSQHLTCFAAGMFALAARALSHTRPAADTAHDMDIAARIAEGCVWSYRSTPTKLGPELFRTVACRRGRDAATLGREPDWTGARGSCEWDRGVWVAGVRAQQGVDGERRPRPLLAGGDPAGWEQFIAEDRLKEGFTEVPDARYILRPETVESLFILYRVTGDAGYQEQAWGMFEAMVRNCRTEFAFAAMVDVTRSMGPRPVLADSMESFFTAETLKYYYLVFSEPGLVSLDEYVLNTEAHPFRWRGP